MLSNMVYTGFGEHCVKCASVDVEIGLCVYGYDTYRALCTRVGYFIGHSWMAVGVFTLTQPARSHQAISGIEYAVYTQNWCHQAVCIRNRCTFRIEYTECLYYGLGIHRAWHTVVAYTLGC